MNNLKKHKINSSVIIVIAIAFVVVLNIFVTVLNNKFPLKIDFTPNKMYELSEKTTEFLKTYDTPVDIYILASASDQDERISSVLEKYAAANKNIKVTNINMAENPTFGKKYVTDGSSLMANSVIIDSGDRFKIHSSTELYGLNAQTGKYTSLNVENKINSALKYVSSDKQLKAYMVTGHNEMSVKGVTDKLTSENYEVTELNTLTSDIPSDASLVMVVRPTADFSEAEITKLDGYLSNGGNIQFYFDVECKSLTNLYKYLKSWGIGVNDNVVVETDMSQSISLGDNGVTLVVPVVKSSEFTDSIIKNKRTLAYFPYSKEITQEFEANGDISVMPLLTSSDKAYTTTNEIVAKTGGEPEGEFIVGELAIDKKHNSSVYVSGNTMLLTRDASVLANDYGLANYDYFMNLTNYTLGNDESFIVDEKALVNNTISLSQANVVVIFAVVVILIPLIILLCGFIIWIKRRNL
ncbi:MAG: Gldg family protein [Hominilimicola sp.]